MPRIILELCDSAKNYALVAQPCADTLTIGIHFFCQTCTSPSVQDCFLVWARKTNKMILKYYTGAGEERNLTVLYLRDNYTNYSPLKWW